MSSSSGKVSLFSSRSSFLLAASHTCPTASSIVYSASISPFTHAGMTGVLWNQLRSKSYFKPQKGGSRRGSYPPRYPKSPSSENGVNSRVTKIPESEIDAMSKHLIPLSMYPTPRKFHAEFSYKQPSERESPFQHLQETMKTLKNPRKITSHLDEYVVGQETAKKILSVAVFNHYKRLEANLAPATLSYAAASDSVVGNGFKVVGNVNKSVKDEKTNLDKSNVLIIGPTGSGKTLLAKTLAQILHVPFSMNDATPFTQAGYVGEDVEVVVQRLLQNSEHNVKLAEQGIIFIDEIDKIARKSDALSQTRDVSGEGVQQSLLRILEGTTVNITEKNANPRPGNVFGGNKTETFQVNTSNILFIMSGAFVGLDKIIADRLAKSSIGFNATVRASSSTSLQTPSVNTKAASSNPLLHVDPTDLIKFGFIPEFIGRIPVIAPVSNLTEESLVRILTEPKNALTKQYESLFHMNETKLVLTEGALLHISKIAIQKQSGARGLRRIMENVLLDPMYDAPESEYKYVVLTKDVINASHQPLYFRADEYDKVLKVILNDDMGHISARLKALLRKPSE